MDITHYITSLRNDGLLAGDYGDYRRLLSRRLLALRRRLGRTTPRGKKFADKQPVTAEDISSNSKFAFLFILQAEKAWAQAMHMKSVYAATSSGGNISGVIKTQVRSRLVRACSYATELQQLLQQLIDTSTGRGDLLESAGYAASLQGMLAAERKQWTSCLQALSVACLIYTSLAKTAKLEYAQDFRSLLSSVVEPNLRYAAHQMKLSRGISLAKLVMQHLPKDSQLVQELVREDPDPFGEQPDDSVKTQATQTPAASVPSSIQWRNRKVKLEEATIAQPLGAAAAVQEKLAARFVAKELPNPAEQAAGYDEMLSQYQDAVDATRSVMQELSSDGMASDDPRMQDLQVTQTYVSYGLIVRRIGRNRILCGPDDGVTLDTSALTQRPEGDKGRHMKSEKAMRASVVRQLREHVVLYDGILQSINSIRELRGVPGDQKLVAELDSKAAYFVALRCLAIGRWHFLDGRYKNALALFTRALTICHEMQSMEGNGDDAMRVTTMDISRERAQMLLQTVQALMSECHGRAELDKLQNEYVAADKARSLANSPLIERMDDYPASGVDLSNLVNYPPRIRPMPVKPIFLDVAWNYIQYPGQENQKPSQTVSQSSQAAGEETPEQPARRGWFGFGR